MAKVERIARVILGLILIFLSFSLSISKLPRLIIGIIGIFVILTGFIGY